MNGNATIAFNPAAAADCAVTDFSWARLARTLATPLTQAWPIAPSPFSILADLFPKERLGAALSVFYGKSLRGFLEHWNLRRDIRPCSVEQGLLCLAGPPNYQRYSSAVGQLDPLMRIAQRINA